MKRFDGKITALFGYTVRPHDGVPTHVDYEYQVTSDEGETLFLLEEHHYEEFHSGTNKPGDFYFYRDAFLGARVRGSYETWPLRELNLIRSIQLI